MRRLLVHVRRSLTTAATINSTSTSTSLQWRRSLELQTLASQVSSLLLHRRRFPSPSIFRSLIPPPLPSSLFLRILSKLRSHPQIALRFFRFAVYDLAFAPDLRSRAAIVQILVDADLFGSARVILDQAIRSEPSAAPLLDSVLRSTTSAAGGSRGRRIGGQVVAVTETERAGEVEGRMVDGVGELVGVGGGVKEEMVEGRAVDGAGEPIAGAGGGGGGRLELLFWRSDGARGEYLKQLRWRAMGVCGESV